MGPKTTAERVEVLALSPYELSSDDWADCSTPDSLDSPGADWLRTVRHSAVEAWEYAHAHDETVNHEEVAGEVVPFYTYRAWQIFTDLGAWTVDPVEPGPNPSSWYTGDPDDFTQHAQLRLYRLALRVVAGVVGALDTAAESEVCDHSWVGGMCHVHPEDLGAVIAARGPHGVECDRCGITYDQLTAA